MFEGVDSLARLVSLTKTQKVFTILKKTPPRAYHWWEKESFLLDSFVHLLELITNRSSAISRSIDTECAWILLHEPVANKNFPSMDSLEETLTKRANYLMSHPDVLKGTVGFGWIRQISG